MARILVVDDYPAILGLLEATLVTAGHEVLTADDGAGGRELASRMKPDLVLLDVDMPDLDGTTVCADLKREPITMHIPVLLMTGRMCWDVLDRARRAGAHGLVAKPFLRDRLLEEVARVLGGSGPVR